MSQLLKYFGLLILLFLQLNSYSQSLFVSKNGNDNNTGSEASPYLTINKAINSALPGYTIYVKNGTYNERIIPQTMGLPNNPITVRNYANDIVTIDGAGVNGWGVLTLYGHQNFIFKNLNFAINDSSAASWQSAVIIGNKSAHIKFFNCVFDNVIAPNSNCMVITGNDSMTLQDILIDSCIFKDVTFHANNGIIINGNVSDVKIQNCEFSYLKNLAVGLLAGDSVCPNFALDYCNNILIENCKLSNIYNSLPGSYRQAILINGAKNCTIRNNAITTSDFGINISAYNVGTVCENVSVYNNIIYKNYLQGLAMGVYDYSNNHGRIKNCIFRNNTLYKNSALGYGGGELNIFPFENCTISNNIFYTNNDNVMGYAYFYDSTLNGNIIDYNIWCTPNLLPSNAIMYWNNNYCNSYGYYKMVSGNDTHSLFVDPMFYNEYDTVPDLRIINNSQAIDAGNSTLITNNNEKDFYNMNRLKGLVDIGCNENQGDLEHNASYYLGINNNLNDSRVEIFPNPANSNVTILCDHFNAAQISITDILGQTFYTSSFVNKTINIDFLSTGIYFLILKDYSGNSISKKLFINK